MKKTKSILVYLDGDCADGIALKSATSIASRNGAHLELAVVVPDVTRQLAASLATEVDVAEFLLRERVEALDAAAASLNNTGLSVSTCVLHGKPEIELTQRVIRNNHNLLIKVARRSESGGLFYGPLAAQLMRICPCPVWIVHPDRADRVGRIVAAVDPNADPERNELNLRVLELASSLSTLHNAQMYVLSAWDVFGAELVGKCLGQEALRRFSDECEESARQQVNELLESIDGLKSTKVHLPRGKASQVIPEFAVDRDSDLVVMGTVCRTGISGFFIGNTAESVLRQLECSLLTVKPAEFLSPVEEGELAVY